MLVLQQQQCRLACRGVFLAAPGPQCFGLTSRDCSQSRRGLGAPLHWHHHGSGCPPRRCSRCHSEQRHCRCHCCCHCCLHCRCPPYQQQPQRQWKQRRYFVVPPPSSSASPPSSSPPSRLLRQPQPPPQLADALASAAPPFVDVPRATVVDAPFRRPCDAHACAASWFSLVMMTPRCHRHYHHHHC